MPESTETSFEARNEFELKNGEALPHLWLVEQWRGRSSCLMRCANCRASYTDTFEEGEALPDIASGACHSH